VYRYLIEIDGVGRIRDLAKSDRVEER